MAWCAGFDGWQGARLAKTFRSYFTVPLYYCPAAANTSQCAPLKRATAFWIVWRPTDGSVRSLLQGMHLSGDWAVFSGLVP